MFKCAGKEGGLGVFECAGMTPFSGSADVFTGSRTGGINTLKPHWGEILGALEAT